MCVILINMSCFFGGTDCFRVYVFVCVFLCRHIHFRLLSHPIVAYPSLIRSTVAAAAAFPAQCVDQSNYIIISQWWDDLTFNSCIIKRWHILASNLTNLIWEIVVYMRHTFIYIETRRAMPFFSGWWAELRHTHAHTYFWSSSSDPSS